MGRRILPLLFGSLLAAALVRYPLGNSVVLLPASGQQITPPDPYDSIRTDLSDYLWPTDVGRLVTSTFAEFRSNHFHGGIDVSTGDETGFRVFASRDGFISRISINPTGYGKLLFVQHPDGYTTVYAHLKKFAGAIQERAVREQESLARYPVDIRPAPHEFPVKKGEVIAYTGETGTGSEHLHFEIRDEKMNYVNPFLCKGLQRYDDMPPVARRIAVRPLGENSRVNGGWEPLIRSLRRMNGRRYVLPETLRITGDVGIALDIYDNANKSRFRSGIHANQLYVDDSLVFAVTLDRAPNDDANQIGLYYDWRLLSEQKGRFAKLYMDSPNRLPFYRPTGSASGIVHGASLSPGLHRMKIIAADFNNNQVSVTGFFAVSAPPMLTMRAAGGELELNVLGGDSLGSVKVYTLQNRPDGKWLSQVRIPLAHLRGPNRRVPIPSGSYDLVKVLADDRWGNTSLPQFYAPAPQQRRTAGLDMQLESESDFIRVVLSTKGVETSLPSVVVREGAGVHGVPLDRLDLDRFAGTFRPSESYSGLRRVEAVCDVGGGKVVRATDEFFLFPIVPGKSGVAIANGGKMRVAYDSASVFTTVFLRVEAEADEGDGTVYSLRPRHTVLNAGLTVMVEGDDTADGTMRLYFRSGSRWVLLSGGKERTGKYFVGRLTKTLGDIALRRDSSPPDITRLRISHASGGKPAISFHCSDNRSGVDYHELKMYIDGRTCIPEIDGEHREISYQVPHKLPRGSHQLTIRLQDRVGNAVTFDRRFAVR